MSKANCGCPSYERGPDGQHVYMSTSCYHGFHDYCQNDTGSAGTKVPAQCKFCAAPCICTCHTEQR